MRCRSFFRSLTIARIFFTDNLCSFREASFGGVRIDTAIMSERKQDGQRIKLAGSVQMLILCGVRGGSACYPRGVPFSIAVPNPNQMNLFVTSSLGTPAGI